MEDISFDHHIKRFRNNICQAPKGIIRRRVIAQGLRELLPELHNVTSPMKIADVGGGLGEDTISFAKLGHEVDYYDLSTEMAAEAQKLARQHGVLDRVSIISGSFQQKMNRSYDLVYAQALLEWLAEPVKGLEILLDAVRTGGFLALVFYNKHSIVLRNLIRGNYYKVDSDEYSGDGKGLTPLHPLLPEEIFKQITDNGFAIRGIRGVRCFSDLSFPHVNIAERLDDVIRLETSFSREEPYCSIARYIFTAAQKNQFEELHGKGA